MTDKGETGETVSENITKQKEQQKTRNNRNNNQKGTQIRCYREASLLHSDVLLSRLIINPIFTR
jgi:hypothetical protein